MSAGVIETALARGVVTPEQAARLAEIARELDGTPLDEPRDSERLRFVTGFADIFVTIGIALFLGAVAVLVGRSADPGGALLLIAILSWGLAEFFTRARRMALPSIVLLCTFAGASFSVLASLAAGGGVAPGGLAASPGALALAALGTAALVAAHYARFRVPITVAAGTAALAGFVLALVFKLAPDAARANLPGLLLGLGAAVFALAMRFDLSDPARTTRRTDIAFWLHLLAAPLIVHPMISSLMGPVLGGGAVARGTAMLVLATVLVLALVALVIDRRALLVSGLVYTGFAFGALIRDAGLATGASTTPAALLALGAFILLLSAGWRPLRAGLLKLFPARLAARLPHPSMAS